jgi:hypothetical protein
MAKQHTFKTTKKTTWLDGILDGAEDKSDLIRELLIEALSMRGIAAPSSQTKVIQSTHISQTHVTQSSPTVTKTETFHVTPTPHGNIEYLEEPQITSKPVAVEDLDKKLSGMDDNFS